MTAAARERGLRIVTAESCSGGLIGAALTDLPGSSDVFWGGFLTYDNQAKIRLLRVDPAVLDRVGAVSEEVVAGMLRGALEGSGAELALAVSGVAGPGGGSAEKPVGTVWIGAALWEGRSLIRLFHFAGDRGEIRRRTVEEALSLGEKIILNDPRLDSE